MTAVKDLLASVRCHKLISAGALARNSCSPVPYQLMGRAESRLLAGLLAARSSAIGACRQLAGQSATVVAALSGALTQLHVDLRTDATFRQDLAKLTTDNHDLDLDLGGRLNRFIVLCYPRAHLRRRG